MRQIAKSSGLLYTFSSFNITRILKYRTLSDLIVIEDQLRERERPRAISRTTSSQVLNSLQCTHAVLHWLLCRRIRTWHLLRYLPPWCKANSPLIHELGGTSSEDFEVFTVFRVDCGAVHLVDRRGRGKTRVCERERLSKDPRSWHPIASSDHDKIYDDTTCLALCGWT